MMSKMKLSLKVLEMVGGIVTFSQDFREMNIIFFGSNIWGKQIWLTGYDNVVFLVISSSFSFDLLLMFAQKV